MANGTQVDTAETTNEQPAGADAPAGARRPRPTVDTAGPSAASPAATEPDTALETERAETERAETDPATPLADRNEPDAPDAPDEPQPVDTATKSNVERSTETAAAMTAATTDGAAAAGATAAAATATERVAATRAASSAGAASPKAQGTRGSRRRHPRPDGSPARVTAAPSGPDTDPAPPATVGAPQSATERSAQSGTDRPARSDTDALSADERKGSPDRDLAATAQRTSTDDALDDALGTLERRTSATDRAATDRVATDGSHLGATDADGGGQSTGDEVRAHRRQRRRERQRARRRRRVATAVFALLPWSWLVLRERGGVWEFAAVVLPVGVPMAVFATACVAALFRRVGPLLVALSMALLGVVTVLGPWRPISGGGPIIAGRELRVVSVNVAAQGGVELAEAVRNQDADVIVVAELSHGIDDALSLVYPYREYSGQALQPWTGRELPPEERANQAGVGVYSRYPLEALADPTTLAHGLPGVRVRVAAPGGALVLYGLHLTKASPNEGYPSVSYAVQRNVAGEVRAAVGREQEPVIVAGDLNLVDRQEAFRMFSSGLRDAMRADAWAGPTSAKLSRAWRALLLRIDHVLVSPQLCARDPERFMAPSSDHRGVAVTVGPCEAG